jgi:hypothetical protein
MLIERFEGAKRINLGLQIPFQDKDFGIGKEISVPLTPDGHCQASSLCTEAPVGLMRIVGG